MNKPPLKNKTLLIVIILIAIAGLSTFLFLNNINPASKREVDNQHHSSPAPNLEENTPSKVLPTIEIPYDKQQMIGIDTTKVQIKPMTKIIRTIGRVSYDETKLASINTKFEGYIEKLLVNYTGQYVKRGQLLASIYSPELLSTQLEFLNLLDWKQESKSTSSYYKQNNINNMLAKDSLAIIEAAKQRLKLFDISDSQIKEIEKTRQPRKTLSLYSPVNGYVVQKMVVQGSRVMPGDNLFDIADLSTVWIIADVYEQDLSLVNPNQSADITLDYFPNKTFSSKVNYIYPTVENMTRTAKARFSIPNYNLKLKPQMYTNMEISVPLGEKLVIPASAVINTGKQKLVYVDLGEGIFQQREVETGVEANNLVEVVKGLNEDEKVATSGNFLIDSEAQLKGITR